MFGSSDRTAEYAGHDVRTLIKTYRRAVAHEEAEKFWAIYPPQELAVQSIKALNSNGLYEL